MSDTTTDKTILDSAQISLTRESFLAALSSLGGSAAALIQTIVLAYFLSVEEVGEFFIYLAVVYLVSQLVKGVGIAVRKRASSVDTNQSTYLYGGLILSLLVLTPIIGAGLFSGSYVEQYVQFSVTTTAIVVTAFATLAKSSNSLLQNYLSGVGKPGLSESIRNYVIRGGQSVFLFIGLSFQPTVSVALFSYGITAIVGSSLYLYFSPTTFIRPTTETIQELVEFAKWSIPNSLLNDLYLRIDTLALGIFVTSTAAGWYDVSVRVALFSFILAGGFSKTVAVKFSGMYESGLDFTHELRWSLRMGTVLIYPFLLVMIIHGQEILTVIYNSSYSGAYPYIIGILAYLVLQTYRVVSESVFNAIDSPDRITAASVTAVVINLITVYPLIIQFGGMGVIYSTIFSELFRTLILGYHLQDYLSNLHTLVYQPIVIILLLGTHSLLITPLSLPPLLLGLSTTLLVLIYSLIFGLLLYRDKPTSVTE